MLLEAVLWGGFGLIFGSFTNVLILRHGIRSVNGRSACMQCHTSLQWYELIPILSWIALRGRCGHCGKRISPQYPAVEALTAAGFLGLGLSSAPLLIRILGCIVIILLIAIAVYDLQHMLMPDRWVWSFNALSLVFAFAFASPLILDTWYLILLSGPMVAAPLFLMWWISAGKWMGFGDVKFAIGIGWLLGVGYGYLALMYAFIIGAIVGVFILLPLQHLTKVLRQVGITRFGAGEVGFTMKSEVPFGPFLILGTCIVWFALIYSFTPILDFPEVLLWWN